MTIAGQTKSRTIAVRPRNQLSKESGAEAVVDEISELKASRKAFCIRATRVVGSHLGLFVALCLYAVAGAFIFQHLETTNERDECFQAADTYAPVENSTALKLWQIAISFTLPGDEPYAKAEFQRQLSSFRDNILVIGYDGSNCSQLGEPGGPAYAWAFPGALLFAVTVFTTVGRFSFVRLPLFIFTFFVLFVFMILSSTSSRSPVLRGGRDKPIGRPHCPADDDDR